MTDKQEQLNKTLWNVCKEGNVDEVRKLIADGASVNFKGYHGWTPLHLAAMFNANPEVCKVLIQSGSNLSAKDIDRYTPLHFAAEDNPNVNVISLLIQAGSDVLARTDAGNTPLHKAAEWNGNTSVVNTLIQLGGDIFAKNNEEGTPLHLAAYNNTNPSVVDCLIQAGADISAKDRDGNTPLHVAAMFNKESMTEAIIQAGADISAKNSKGETPLDLARKHSFNKDVLTLIQSYISGEKVVHKQATVQQPSVELKQILSNDSTYESFDMRVMVVGKYGVGKTTLVKLLVGDEIPMDRLPTDGITLLEGRCGLDIESKKWILIDKDDYDAKNVMYNKMMMPTHKDTTEEMSSSSSHSPSEKTDESQSLKSTEPQPVSENIGSSKVAREIETKAVVRPKINTNLKTKLSKVEFKKRLELALKNGTYEMKVGRLIFWDFGGQYVYYTSHQTFMTVRALFLVVFDGSKDIHTVDADEDEFIPGQHGKPTPAVFLQHWVNSVLTYCQQIPGFEGFPKILFVATNKDKCPKDLIEERRAILFKDIDTLFKDHEGRHHLVLQHKIFLNATDKEDPELENLKRVITDLTFSHPCWGEKMPKKWVPLELEIAEHVSDGKQILSLVELDSLNKSSEVSVLSLTELKAFLRIQHSLGKIVYFDNPLLKDFVIINPLYMVEVMRSFVTDEHFWPVDRQGRNTFRKMAEEGVITKSDLFSLWEREEFLKLVPHKEFILNMLVHLDILSEQRRYDMKTGKRRPVNEYFIPCMVVRKNTTNYMEKIRVPARAIGLAFVFNGTVVPPALPNRLISACMNAWALKDYGGKKMLFSGLAVLAYDKLHDVVICVENNKILLFIVHNKSKDLIVPDISTSLRECILTSLERISDFYQRSVSIQLENQQLPFSVHHACPELKCYLPRADISPENIICAEHEKEYKIYVWYQKRDTEHCSEDCQGLSEDALVTIPSDTELLRLSKQFGPRQLHDLAICLGITENEWETIHENHPYNAEWVKFLVLNKWKVKKSGKYRAVLKALTDMEFDTHTLCQVRRMKTIVQEECIPEEFTDLVPTDKLLDDFAPVVGKEALELGIELGLRIHDLEQIQHDYKNHLVKQTREILQIWRDDRSIKASFGVLQQALVNVGRGTLCLEEIIENFVEQNKTFSYHYEHSKTESAEKTQLLGAHEIDVKISTVRLEAPKQIAEETNNEPILESQQKAASAEEVETEILNLPKTAPKTVGKMKKSKQRKKKCIIS